MWTLPSDIVLARGASYDGGGPWDPNDCKTEWTPEAAALEATIRARFPWVRRVGGIRCESHAGGTQMSIHAIGRALDVMVPTLGGSEGEALANWLVANARQLGLQLVIWNRGVWQSTLGQRGVLPYTGPNSHVDHVHVEVLAGPGTGGALVAAGPRGVRVLVVAGALSVGLVGAGLLVASVARRFRRR